MEFRRFESIGDEEGIISPEVRDGLTYLNNELSNRVEALKNEGLPIDNEGRVIAVSLEEPPRPQRRKEELTSWHYRLRPEKLVRDPKGGIWPEQFERAEFVSFNKIFEEHYWCVRTSLDDDKRGADKLMIPKGSNTQLPVAVIDVTTSEEISPDQIPTSKINDPIIILLHHVPIKDQNQNKWSLKQMRVFKIILPFPRELLIQKIKEIGQQRSSEALDIEIAAWFVIAFRSQKENILRFLKEERRERRITPEFESQIEGSIKSLNTVVEEILKKNQKLESRVNNLQEEIKQRSVK